MNRFLAASLVLAIGTLALSGCGGSGGSGGGTPQVFPNGLYVSLDSTFKMAYMADMTGTGWNKQSVPSPAFGIAFDPAGNMLCANWQNNRIMKFTNPADLSGPTFLGTAGSGVLQFNNPTDVAVDNQGRIYIADSGNKRIVRVDDFTGAGWSTLDVSSVSTAGSDTFDVCVGNNGKIYFCCRASNKIGMADSMSDSSLDSYATGLALPSDIQVDSADRIYVADTSNNRIVRIDDISGTGRLNFGSVGSGTNQFSAPIAVGIDGSGRIYVLDSHNARICRFNDMAGANWTTFGSDGTGVGQFVADGLADLCVKD